MKKEDILNQNEIDALMDVFTDRKSEVPSRKGKTPRKKSVTKKASQIEKVEQQYDSQAMKNRTWVRLQNYIQKTSNTISQILKSSLSELMENRVTVSTANLAEEPIPYIEFLESINSPSCLGIFTSKNRVSEVAIIELDLNLAYAIIDKLMGGVGDTYMGITKPLSELELELITDSMKNIQDDLDQALKLDLEIETVVTHPHNVPINSPYELVVPFTFDAVIDSTSAQGGAGASGEDGASSHVVTLGLPYIALESKFQAPQNSNILEKKKIDHYEIIQQNPFINMPLNLQIQFPKLEMTIKKLMELEVGSIIDLNMEPDLGDIKVDVLVERCPKYKGQLGMFGKYKAIEIISKPSR